MTLIPSGRGAVMAGRVEPPDSLDYFPTPPWATRALLEHVLPQLGVKKIGSVWEPACGEGHMAAVIAEYVDGLPVIATDIFDYGYGKAPVDFLGDPPAYAQGVEWIITNPPFKTAIQFALKGIERASCGVALLCRLQWIEGNTRYNELFKVHPPALFAPFVERVPMVKGRWDPTASTATSYAWFVWMPWRVPQQPTRAFWIPPGCRKSLTKPTDRERFGPPAKSTPLIEPPSTAAVAQEETHDEADFGRACRA